MNNIDMTAESEVIEPSSPDGAPHVSVDITVTVDDKEFGSTFANVEVMDGYQLLSTRHAGGSPYILSCGCGEPVCVGINDGILVTRSANSVMWRFQTGYNTYLIAHGYAAGQLFEFDREHYDASLDRLVAFVLTEEAAHNLRICVGGPVNLGWAPTFEEQLAKFGGYRR